MPQEHCVFLRLFVFPSHLSQPLYVWFYCTDCSLAIGCTCSKADTQNSACPHWLTPSPKSCSVTSRLQTGGQQEARCSSKQDCNFFHNLCEPKSKAAWAGAPSAGIPSTDCLHWGTARFGCPLGTRSFVNPRGHSATGPCLAVGHGTWWCPRGEEEGTRASSYTRAAEAWGGCKSCLLQCDLFPKLNIFCFLGTTDLAWGLPWVEENRFLQGWLAARRIKYVYFFSARYHKYSPCKASFHCLSCLTVRGHSHMFPFPAFVVAASTICVPISHRTHSTEDRRAQTAVKKSWLMRISPQLGPSTGAKSNFLHRHILY